MAQYDLYVNGDGYLLEVQSELLDQLDTRIVVPLICASDAPKPMRRLNPIVVVNGKNHVLVPQFLAAIQRKELGEPNSNLAHLHDDIRAAMDMVFIGF
jgi:toxin CcdB